MSDLLKFMINLWDMTTIDWMGFDNDDKYSFHHIIKKSDGGKHIITNGAVLHQNSSHPYLHTIEHYDPDKYIFINKILKDVNSQLSMPTKEQLLQIRMVLMEFQREYEGKTSSRNKPIIKKEYILEDLK